MRKPSQPTRRKSQTPVRKSRGPTGSKTPLRGSPNRNRNTSEAPSNNADVSRRTRHFKRGTKSLREIRSLQRTTNLLIPKACFCRLVKEIIHQFSYHQLRIQSSALEALQEATEMYMIQFFEDSLLCTLHAKRVTLTLNDCYLMRRLRGPAEVGNK